MYLADEAVIVTNPEVSSCRDSDKMVGFISSKSRRAEMGEAPVRQTLLVTRYGEHRRLAMALVHDPTQRRRGGAGGRYSLSCMAVVV